MKFFKSLQVFLVTILIIGLATPISTQAAVVKSGDLMKITKTVSNNTVVKGETTDVTMTVKGTPKDSTFVKPNDVVLIVDKSGSMQADNRLNAAKDAAKEFIDLMDLTKHEVAIVDYSSGVSSFPLTTDKNAAKAYVDTIQLGGSTNTSAAINEATAMLANKRAEAQPTIVIMTDGAADSAHAALASAKAAKDAGITFYSIALLAPNEDPNTSAPNKLLKEMASSFDHHHFVLGSVGLSDVYRQIVEEIGLASAYNVTITDTIAPEFELVPGSYENHIPKPTVTGNKIEWFISELKTNELNFTYQVRAKADATAGNYPVAQTATTFEMGDGSTYSLNTTNPIVTITNHAPIITSVTEDKGLTTGGDTVTIAGQHFLPGAKVYFGTALATVISVTDNEIIVTNPSGKQGSAVVKVENTDNQFATGSFNYYANPAITSITPAEGPLVGGNNVTIIGSNFMSGVKVFFNDVEGKTALVSGSRLTVTVPPAAQDGPVTIKIINPDATEVELPDGYTYLAPPPAPIIELTSLSVTSGETKGGGSITILGKNFDRKVKVYFGDAEPTVTFISSSQIRIITPATATPGSVSVKAENPDGTSAELVNVYEYLTPALGAAPEITSISEDSILTGKTKEILLYGKNLNSKSKVFIGNQEAKVTFLAATRLRVAVPISTVAGTVDVTVENADNQSAVLSNAFTYNEAVADPAPIITSLDIVAGSMAGSETITITGQNFKSGAKVYFDSSAAVILSVTATEIKVKTPASKTTGLVSVKVVNADQLEATLLDAFEYEGKKVIISSLSADSGSSAGKYNILLYGGNFDKNMTVTVGGQPAKYTILAATRIRIEMPAGTPGTVDIAITLGDQTTTVPFTYN